VTENRDLCDIFQTILVTAAVTSRVGYAFRPRGHIFDEDVMRKIVVLNTKGGCGKSTIATNLAAWHAVSGFRTTLMDYDPQGSSMRWLSRRDETRPRVNGVAAAERSTRVTRSWQLRVPMQTECLIVDTPAGLEPQRLTEVTRNAHAVVVPVLP